MAQTPRTKPTRPGTKPFRIDQHHLETFLQAPMMLLSTATGLVTDR